MATTAIFIEIMIIGFFAFLWLFLLLTRLGVVDPLAAANALTSLKEWSTLIVLVFAAVVYQLGSLTNTLCYGLSERIAGERIRKKMTPYPEYEKASATVFHKGSAATVAELNTHLTYIRLARAAAFNFLFLGITLLLFGTRFWKAGVLSLLFSAASCPIWRIIFVLRQQDMKAAYDIIVDAEHRPTAVAAGDPNALLEVIPPTASRQTLDAGDQRSASST
jgi:hypothetical protein